MTYGPNSSTRPLMSSMSNCSGRRSTRSSSTCATERYGSYVLFAHRLLFGECRRQTCSPRDTAQDTIQILQDTILVLCSAYHLCFLLNAHAPLSTSFSWLKAQHIGTKALSFSELEANLSIGVQAKRQGGLRGHCLINVLQHLQTQNIFSCLSLCIIADQV